ncbi:hypothetical protein AMTRI_Chr08g209320 [Amborella trichopoda]
MNVISDGYFKFLKFHSSLNLRNLCRCLMDLATENRLAMMLLEEARKLREQADKEGVHVYLRQPKVRGRPNSRFLTATVRGVQQANRAAEVNEMWRLRKKELELDNRLKDSRDKEGPRRDSHHHHESSDDILKESSRKRCRRDSHHHVEKVHKTRSSKKSSSSRFMSDDSSLSEEMRERDLDRRDEGIHKRSAYLHRSPGHRGNQSDGEDYSSDDGSLKDEEVEEFLHSRTKRGRGSVGSKMDETGPYLQSDRGKALLPSTDERIEEEWEKRVFGPQKPLELMVKDECNSKASRSKRKHKGKKNKKKKKRSRHH